MIVEYFFEVAWKYANIFFVILCEAPLGESHLYDFWSSVVTRLTSHQQFDVHPIPFEIKERVVDFLNEVKRPSFFHYFHCFVDLVLECFQVEKC